mgnify:CR=1 FL=1
MVLVFDELTPDEVVIEVSLAEGSHLDVALLQENVKSRKSLRVEVNQKGNSCLSISIITIGCNNVTNDMDVQLVGEGADLRLLGLYLTDGGEKVTNRTIVTHQVGHCTTNQLYKGALGGESQASFEGKIIVNPNAQKALAQQTNRNILLSDKAKVHAEPQLEIYADDVKCSHGATTGQIDLSQLFYMQQRGIDEDSARRLLTAAYAAEVVNQIPIVDVRECLTKQLFGEI